MASATQRYALRQSLLASSGSVKREEAVSTKISNCDLEVSIKMKVLISADMEGVCGVSSWVHVTPPEYGGTPSSTVEYERARQRLTKETNAAVEGALEGGATEVIVNDAHNGMRNLIAEELHPEVRFITGSDKTWGMMQGIEEVHGGIAFYIGYHARAGTPGAPLAHTWTGYLLDVRFDGRSTGEYGINAAIAGHFDTPVALVTGDEKAVAQTKAFLGQDIQSVVVKTGYSSTSALHLHPERAQALIRKGAEAAVRNAGEVRPWTLPKDCAAELEFDHPSRADACLYHPGVTRVADRTVRFVPGDGACLFQTFRALIRASDIRLSP